MKKKAFLFLLSFVCVGQLRAENNSSLVYQTTLRAYEINHESFRDVETGSVSVNQSEKNILLSLQPEPVCPSDMFCILVIPEPIQIKLSLVKQYVNECGAAVYIAERNKVLVDGVKEVIKVLDHSKSSCSNYAEIEVEYNSNSPWMDEAKSSHFSGESFDLSL